MTYDAEVANRLREVLAEESGVREKAMFGGLAFLLGGHMAVAAGRHGDILLRCDPADTQLLLARPGAEPMVMRGREMVGWITVLVDGCDDDDLTRWVEHGVRYARSLPPR